MCWEATALAKLTLASGSAGTVVIEATTATKQAWERSLTLTNFILYLSLLLIKDNKIKIPNLHLKIHWSFPVPVRSSRCLFVMSLLIFCTPRSAAPLLLHLKTVGCDWHTACMMGESDKRAVANGGLAFNCFWHRSHLTEVLQNSISHAFKELQCCMKKSITSWLQDTLWEPCNVVCKR